MMKRLTTKDFSPEVLELYDRYAHGKITKREFLTRTARFAVGGLTAGTLLTLLRPNYSLAQQVPANDPDISADYIVYPSPKGHGEVRAYRVTPAQPVAGKLPSVVIVHENRGLNPYIEDVARRLAKEGFFALAPDGLTSLGGYPGEDDKGREMQSTLDPIKLRNDFLAGVEYLLTQDDVGKVGIIGFCYGGGVANAAAASIPQLAAAVPFYGAQPDVDEVAGIEAALLLHYAENDARVNAGWDAYEAALKEHGKTYQAHFYPGTHHGFHNDTTPRYDKEAAELAWSRTVDWLKQHLN